MKIKCHSCGKKYKDLYTNCPYCGTVHLVKTVTRSAQTGTSRPIPPSVAKPTAYTSQKTGLPLRPIHTEAMSGNASNSTSQESMPQKKKLRGLWYVLAIILGIMIPIASTGSQLFIKQYREKVNPTTLQIQRLAIGEPFEQARAYVYPWGLYDMSEVLGESFKAYIPKGYQLVGMHLSGQMKADDAYYEQGYGTEFYLSYVRETTRAYANEVADARIIKQLTSLGYERLYNYSSYYGGNEGFVYFVIPEEATDLVFNFTQLKDEKLRGTYRDITYEVPVSIEPLAAADYTKEGWE